MKSCYYLVLALMFITILVAPVIVSPVMAQEMKTIEVIVGDEDYQFLNDVIIIVYEIVGGIPGPLHSEWTIDSGDTITLPMGEYFLVPAKPDYLASHLPSSPGGVDVPEESTQAYIIMYSVPGVGYPVKIRAIDENEVLIPDVTFKIYRCTSSPPYSPIELIRIETSASGEVCITDLPKDYYCVEVEKEGYSQRYATGENRFANQDAFPTLNIVMDTVGEGEAGTVEVRIVDVDTEEPLQNVRVRIYEALPNFQQGRLVKEVTVSSGDYISLPAGRYFAQATKSGYTQYFEVTNTRVTVDPPSPAILYIPMTSRDGVTPGEGSFLDQSIEGIANLFGVSFGVGKTILGMLLALGIGTATAKHLRGGAQEFGMGMLGGVVLGVLIGLLPIWVLVLLVLIIGLWIGQRYMSGGDS